MSRRRLALSVGLASTWQFGRIGLQFVWLIVVGRALGPGDYGTFAGTAALATALSTVTGLGLGLLMLQRVSQDPSAFGPAWHQSLRAAMLSGTVMAVGFAWVVHALLPGTLDLHALGAIAITELICFPLVVLSSHAFQAHDRMGYANAVMLLIPTGNLIAAACFLISGGLLADYVAWHVLGAILMAAVALALVRRRLLPGPATRWRLQGGSGDLRAGMSLSTMRVADTALASLDKTLVLNLAGPEAAGLYTVAYRLATVLAIPVGALAMIMLPHLYRQDHSSAAARTRTTRLLMAALALGALASLGMWILAGVLPLLLGAEFAASVQSARQMAAAPLLLGLCGMACNLLLAQGRILVRTLAQAAGIAAMVVLSMLLVQKDATLGAAWMLQITLAITAAVLWFVVWKQVHSDEPPPSLDPTHGQNPDPP